MLLRFANHLSNQVFKETLIYGGIDHGAVQRAMPSKHNIDMPNVPLISLRFFRRILGRTHTQQPPRYI